MAKLVPDPLADGGIAGFGGAFRKRRTTSEAATKAYLDRIQAVDKRLGSYEHVAVDAAIRQARAIDALFAAGTDLGPLMGVPVAIKDLIQVDGMPATAGSNLDVASLIGPEGPFIKRLKQLGVVILGKVKTVEFAMGGTGINLARGTPWNPWDAKAHRITGGSSSGSAVAAIAGLAGFAIGSDTGGSVRLPAFSGTFALKTTHGLWPTDGVSALSPSLDSLGPMTRTAADAAVVFAAYQGIATPRPASARGLRFGRPSNHFFDDLEPAVAACAAAALDKLAKAGVEIVEFSFPEIAEHRQMILATVTAEFIAVMGRERFLASRDSMDPDVWSRLEPGLAVKADDYVRFQRQRVEHGRLAMSRMEGLDGWIMPTNPMTALTLESILNPKGGRPKYIDNMGRNTYSANLMGLCATTTPIQQLTGTTLPIGFQLMCPGGDDARALSIALFFEELFGRPPVPALEPFL